MAGAISGAMHGLSAIPEDWAADVAAGSRIELHVNGKTMAAVAREVFERDLARERRQSAAFAELAAQMG